MDVQKLQDDLRNAQESIRQLSVQLADAADRIADLTSRLVLAQKRIEELEGKNGGSPTEKIAQPSL